MTLDPGTASLFGQLAGHVAGFLAQRAEDFAADRVTSWWRASAVETAIAKVAARFPEYAPLAAALGYWVKKPLVGEALAAYRRSATRAAEMLLPLTREFERHFTPATGMSGSVQVLDAFFEELSGAYLEEEGATHATAIVANKVDTVQDTLKAHSQTLAEIKGLLLESRMPARPVDALAQCEGLLASGKPQTALDLIAQLRKDGGVQPGDEYKTLATEGNALLQLGRTADAKATLEEARRLRPERANAIANVAVCELYLGDLPRAKELSEQALAKEANNAQALRVLAQVLVRQGEREEALAVGERLPEAWERDYLIGTLLLHQLNNPVAALPRLERAYQAQTAEPWLILRLGTAILAKAKLLADQQEIAPWGKVPEEFRREFGRAEGLLDMAVGMFDGRQGAEGLVDALAQRALLRSFLGHQGAKADFDRLAALQSPLEESLLEHAANYWNSHGHHRLTIRAIADFQRGKQMTPELTRLLAYAYGLAKRYSDALALLRALPSDAQSELAQADLYSLSGDVEGARQALDRVPPDQRADWRYAVRAADVQFKLGNAPAAVGILRGQIDSTAPRERWRLRLVLAEHFIDVHDWPAAVSEYRQVLTPDSPPHFIANYIAALFNTGEVKEALLLAKEARERRGLVRQIAAAEAQVLEMLGRLDDADALYAQMLESSPGNVSAKVHRAFIAFQRGDESGARGLLPGPAEVKDLAAMEAFEAAVIRSWLDDPMGALTTAYVAYRSHTDEREAHLAYVGIFFSVEPLVDKELHPDAAGLGTWVTLDVRGREAVHEILSPGEPQTAANQHPPASDFARHCAGRKVGDTFELDSETHESVTIKAIRHQLVGVLQDIMQHFETRFPGQEGLRSISFRGPEDLPTIQKALAAKRERGEELAAHYRTMPMPLAMLARLLGMTDLEAWYGVMQNPEFHPVLVSDGSPEAQAAGLQMAVGSDPLVLETSAIGALAELDMLRHLRSLARPIFVATSVVSEFLRATLKIEEDLRRGSTMVLEERGGKIYHTERTREAIEAALALQQKTLAWLRDPANCTVAGLELEGDVRWSMRATLSTPSVDSMVMAREKQAVLVSDDLRLRGLCANEFGRSGVGSPQLLIGLVAARAISKDEYNAAFIRTVQWGYYFSPVNDDIMDAAFREDGLTVGARFRAVTDCLADPSADLSRVVNCAALFLKRLKLHAIAGAGMSAAAMYVYSVLFRRGNWPATEQLLELRLGRVMFLLPRQLEELRQELEIWKRSLRFLPGVG
jgi:tetratricopeptide (TPR) repeat protein